MEALDWADRFACLSASDLRRWLYNFSAHGVRRSYWNTVLWETLGRCQRQAVDALYDPINREGFWQLWRHRHNYRSDAQSLKAYLCVPPSHLVDRMDAIVELCVHRHVPAFKLPRLVGGLSRPDRAVFYFADSGALLDFAHAVETLLCGSPISPVPFSPVLTSCPHVRWGLDLPTADAQEISWRWHIVRILACAWTSYRGKNMSPWDSTLLVSQLEKHGISPGSWEPRAEDFSGISHA